MGRTDAEVEMPIPWTSDVKNWLTGKDPDAGKDWRQEEKGMTVDEMVGWHHRLNGPESEQVPGVGDIHGSLAWGCKDVYMTEWLNWTKDYGSLDEKEACVCAKFLKLSPTLCDPVDWGSPVASRVTPRLLCPWDSPGKNTGLGCHALLQGIFSIQGLKPHLWCLLNCQVDW